MYVTHSAEPDPAFIATTIDMPETSRAMATCQKRHAVGTNLFHEGDHATHVYEVKSGVLRLTRVLENGRRQVIAFGFPGDIVGFPNGERHHTDCDVLADAEIVAHKRRMLETGNVDPWTHRRLLRTALRGISGMQDHFMMLARKSAVEKVASFLVVLSRRTGTVAPGGTTFPLPMTRTDIGDFLGLSIETVSRTFSLLRKSGMIELRTAHTVIVRDMDALIEAAEAADG